MTENSKTRTNELGFTLIEVLISVFIFSLISVGSMGALSSSLSAKAVMQDRLEALSELQQMRALIKADMASIVLRQNRDLLGGFDPVLLRGGDEVRLLEFTRNGRDNPGYLRPRGDLQRVSYIFEGETFIRQTLDHENPAPQTERQDRILLKNLQTADILFHTQKQVDDRVELIQDPSQTRPDMIELRLTFVTGETLTQYFGLTL